MTAAVKAPITASSLIERIFPVGDSRQLAMLRAVLVTVIGAQLLWVSAKVHVPFWPVPMTMQTYAILALAGLAGWRVGTAAVLLYLAEGAMGLPVFSGTPERGLGVAYMMGPTGGYLVGFVLSALIAGYACQVRGSLRFVAVLFGMIAAHLAVFIPGVAWLGTIMGYEEALMLNLTQFGVATLLKTGLAIATVYGVWQFTGADRHSKLAD